jgi:hypothetical protein
MLFREALTVILMIRTEANVIPSEARNLLSKESATNSQSKAESAPLVGANE